MAKHSSWTRTFKASSSTLLRRVPPPHLSLHAHRGTHKSPSLVLSSPAALFFFVSPLDSEVAAARFGFQLYDMDCSGSIEAAELAPLLGSLQVPCEEHQVLLLADQMDKDKVDHVEKVEGLNRQAQYEGRVRFAYLERGSSYLL